MKMEKKQYQNLLAPLPTGVLDGLRRMVEFVDKALTREHRRDIRLKEDGFWSDSGFDAATFGEVLSDKSCKGAKEVEKALTSDWHVFTNDLKGALHLHHDNYVALKSALKDALREQPFGYERTLERPTIKPQVSVVKKDDTVYVQFGDEKPIRIGDADGNQGKLLRLLGNPFGNSRRTDTVSEELGGDDETIKNAMKEIQRKLVARGKPNSLRLVFEGDVVWLESA